MLIALWLTLGYYFFLRALEEEQPSRFVCWGFAAICALNVLTKGLIGLVFPAGAIGLYLLLTGDLRRLLKLRLVSSSLVFLAIAAPWHILAAIRIRRRGRRASFLWFYFINEHLMRFLGKRVPPGFDTAPLGIFWGLLARVAFALVRIPAASSARCPGAMAGTSQPARKSSGPAAARESALLFMGARDRGLLQLLDAAGVLHHSRPCRAWRFWLALGSRVNPDPQRANRIAAREGSLQPFCLFLVSWRLWPACLFCSVSHRPAPGADLADLLKKNPQEYNFSLGHVLDLTPQALGAFRGPLLGASLGLFLGTGLNWILRRRRRPFRGEYCARCHDGRVIGLRAFLLRYVFPNPVFLRSRGGDSKAVSAG